MKPLDILKQDFVKLLRKIKDWKDELQFCMRIILTDTMVTGTPAVSIFLLAEMYIEMSSD
jgi:hypothetical protein